MTIQQINALPAYAVSWVRLLAGFTLLLGIMVLCGWILDIDALKRVLPGMVSMKANTAVGLLLSGAVLYLQTFQALAGPVLWCRRMSIALVLVIGVLSLAEYLFDWDAGIDQLLFSEPDDDILTSFPGRMSILTAGCFVALASTFLLTEFQRYWSIIQSIAVIIGIIAILPLVGYLYGDIAFPPMGNTTPMAEHTALGFILLSAGVLFMTSTVGFVARLQNKLPMLGGYTSLVLLLLAGIAVLHAMVQSKQATRLMVHAYEVNLHLESVVSNLHQYRSGVRTFIITLQENRLLEAEQARERLLAELDTLKKLTSDRPDQQQRFTSLLPVFEQRFALANEMIRIRRQQGLDALAISPVSNQADRLSEDIIQQLQQIKTIELSMLQQQKQLAGSRHAISIMTLAFSALFVLMLLFGTFRALRREITEHSLIEKRLKDSEARLRALFNTSAIGIVVIDEQGRIEEFNPVSEIMFGYSHEEVIGQNVNMLMPEPYHSEHDGYIKNYLTSGQRKIIGIERELTGKSKGNVIFPIELRVGEANLGSQRIFVAFIKDITKRKQMEARSRYLEAIVQSSDDAIMGKTLDGIITSWNTSAEHMFGYTSDEVIGNPMLKLFPPDRLNEEKFILEQIAHGHRVNHFETVRIRKDGTPIEVSVTLSPILDDAGKIIGASKIAREITRSKQLERELYAAKQTAEIANRTKSEFLANMSHEIRTPMNAIIGLTRLAMETELTLKQQDYLQKIQRSSQVLLGILNDILDLSKIESGRMEIERIEFNPTQMLQGVSDLFIARVEEKGLELFLDIVPEIPLTLMGDPLRIQQILSNLIGNAIKFTTKGEIHIRTEIIESSGDDLLLRFSVRDTGIGISESAIGQLFQPFSQADASITRKYGGTGLGLVISKQLVELLGGSIAVSSQPGQGSTFSFTVRCGKGRSYSWEQDSYQLKDTHVLVVDDQSTSCVILQNILESWHFCVETALSAEEGLEKIYAAETDGAPFNLLLLDWQLDGMSGLDLAHELALEESQGKLRHQPTIIMVTAYNKEQLLKEASSTAARIDGILTKPVVPSTLLNTILHIYHYRSAGLDNRAAPEAQINPYEAARPLHNARILLVEDNELNQQVAVEFLEKAGLRVSIASHGGEAVQLVQSKKFDAVLMDLQMPEMDGYEATRRIRELPGCLELPIIAMTAAAMKQDREACLAVGMNDHIAKPINPRELIDTLLRWVKPVTAPLIPSPPIPDSKEAWPNLADRLPGFELTNIMTILSGDQGKLLTMLAAFREKFSGEASAIAGKINLGELASAEKRLHTLKGTAGNLGARDLYLASATLDAQLLKGHYDTATRAQWLEIFDSTMTTLAALPGQPLSKASSTASDDEKTLWKVLAELDVLLAEDDFISDDLLIHLKTLLPDDKQAEYAILTQHILTTNYPKARFVLKTIMEMLNGQS